MTARRLLLIDSDPEFQQLLESRLGPHGFAILTPPDPANPLGQVKELNPAVIFIAVELPDKIGYALCNKAKKGPASHVPVVLVTSTVPASGFKSHRKLKVHADEYIDKRTMTPDDVMRVVDLLVGLGNYVPAAVEDMDVEELDVDDLDMAEDVDAEFGDEEATPEPVDEPLRPTLGSVGFEMNAFGVEGTDGLEDLADEIDRAMDEVSGVREMPHALFLDSGRAVPGPDEVVSSAQLGRPAEQAVDGGEFEADRTAVADAPEEPELDLPPPPERLRAVPPPEEEEKTAGDEVPEPPVADAVPSPIPAVGSGGDLDLGLEEVASQAEEEKSGVQNRRYQVRALQLEEEVARLKAQIDDSRRQPASGGTFSREREFLNLREVINKKEKEIIELRESLAARDGEILKFRQTIRELRTERNEFDEKNVELEREMLNMRERMEEIENERTSLVEQKNSTERILAAARAELLKVNEELGGERTARREERESLARERARALEDQKQELEDARTQAEAELREQYGRDLRTLKEAYDETAREKELEAERQRLDERAASDTRREQEVAELARVHAEAVARLEREKAAERAVAEAAMAEQLASELAEAESRRERELAEAERRRSEDLAEADRRRVTDLAAAEERLAAAENALAEKFEGERAALAQEHREELAALDKRIAERDAAVATRDLTIRGLESDLVDARDSERGRVETIESLHRLLADRDQRISAQRAEMDELERMNTGYQDQILRAHQRIKSDETTVTRAKKALAVALTLLDDADPAAPRDAGPGGNGR